LEGVSEVKAAAVVSLEDFVIRQQTDDESIKFISTEVVAATMTGIYSEVSLSIPAGTTFTMPLASQTSIEVAAVEVSQNLTDAVEKLVASFSLRRSENGVEYGIIGPTILLSPSQATFSPAIAITLPFNTTKVNRTANTQRLAVYKWNERVNQWVEVTGSVEIRDGVLAASTSSFGYVTVMAVPMKVPKAVIVTTPLVDLKDYAELITATELIMKKTLTANAQSPYKETGIYIPKDTLVTLFKAGQSGIFVDFTDLSLEQTNALLRSQSTAIVSDWVTSFSPVTKFSPAINLTIMYSIQRMKAVGRRTANERRMAVHQWNDANGNWQEILPEEGSILKDGVATFYTKSLGVFAVMTVPVTPILLEPPEADSSPKLMTIVPAAIGATCLILMCACISFALYRRNLGKKELAKVKSALERRKEPKPDIEPAMLRLAKEDQKVSDKFQPADDVSALEISEQMAKKMGDADDHVIDPSVLILAQQLAESESPRVSNTGAQAGSASVYDMSSVQPSTLDDDGLSQVSRVGVVLLMLCCHSFVRNS
jgi:hypothetical protein